MTFDDHIQSYLRHNLNNIYFDNWDELRFGPQKSRSKLKGLLWKWLYCSPFKTQMKEHNIKKALKRLEPFKDHLNTIYQILADDKSRETLVEVWAYRMLGFLFVKLPLNTMDYWSQLDKLALQTTSADFIPIDFNNWKLFKFNLNAQKNGEEGVEIYLTPKGILTEFILQQYRCMRANQNPIQAEVGDVVIDAGACYGDTALYFANKVGSEGAVYSLEFFPANIRLFEKNLNLNPKLRERINLIPSPLWSESGKPLYIRSKGPAAAVTNVKPSGDYKCVKTETIDSVAKSFKVKIDFIKMDIEGAELEALRGAEQTLLRDKPKLAIALYHYPHDFWEIPAFLDKLNIGYKFYLRHYTVHAEETVLFAEAG